MLTIFSRRELFITFSMDEQMRICNQLADAGIAYQLKTIQTGSGGRRSAGRGMVRLGELPQYNCEYLFFVHKNDWEQARHVIGR